MQHFYNALGEALRFTCTGLNRILLDRPETPPNPTIIIPFGRDKHFVPRAAILDKVEQLNAEPSSRVALVGLGGVG